MHRDFLRLVIYLPIFIYVEPCVTLAVFLISLPSIQRLEMYIIELIFLFILCKQDHVEGYMELSAKTKTYFSTAVALWDADFYVKVDDDVHVNLGN